MIQFIVGLVVGFYIGVIMVAVLSANGRDK